MYASSSLLRAWPGGGSGGARSWTGNLLCTPLAANFGPGPEAAAGRGVCFVFLSPQTSDLALRRQRRGALLDGEISFHSHCRLRAWPGGGSGGALSWTRACSAVYASRSRLREGAVEGRSALAWSSLFYLSQTGLSTRGPAMLGHWSQHHLRI